MEIRIPAVAGTFYPGDRSTLQKEAGKMLVRILETPWDAFGVMVPHAGHVYSGGVAGKTFASIKPPSTAIVLGPNHAGTGTPASLWNSGKWSTPLGDIEVDSALASLLLSSCSRLVPDRQAHFTEHSIEVQLPFLQMVNPAMKIVPILIRLGNLAQLLEIGRKISGILEKLPSRPLIVASSDMNHYESHDLTLEKDGPVLDAMLKLDPERMWKEVQDGRVSMCGVQPAVIMLEAVRKLGATRAHLVEHTTSGPVSGDYGRTVGYAGFIAG